LKYFLKVFYTTLRIRVYRLIRLTKADQPITI